MWKTLLRAVEILALIAWGIVVLWMWLAILVDDQLIWSSYVLTAVMTCGFILVARRRLGKR